MPKPLFTDKEVAALRFMTVAADTDPSLPLANMEAFKPFRRVLPSLRRKLLNLNTLETK